MEEDGQFNVGALPPKNKVQRVNALLTALDEGSSLPYDQCIRSLYGEVQDKLTGKEEKELKELEDTQDKSLTAIRNCQNIISNCGRADIIAEIKTDLLNYEKEYSRCIRQIELILRKAANRIEGAKEQRLS